MGADNKFFERSNPAKLREIRREQEIQREKEIEKEREKKRKIEEEKAKIERRKNKEKQNKNKNIYKYYILFIGSPGIGIKSLFNKIKDSKYLDDNKKLSKTLSYKKNKKEYILYFIDSDEDKENLDPEVKGEKKIINIVSKHYHNADCIVMGYDVTNKQSFEEIKTIFNEKIKDKINTNLIYLLANKIDLQNQIVVPQYEGKEFSDKNNFKFFPISVQNEENIQNFFDDLKINLEKIDNFYEINSSRDEFKISFVGDSGTSKTSLMNRLLYDKFEENIPSTKASSYSPKLIKSKMEKDIIIDIWDNSGQEQYKSLIKFFIKDRNCIIIMYDITNRASFENIKDYWYKTIKEFKEKDTLVYLVGNKMDLLDNVNVDEDDAKDYAKEKNMKFFNISCLSKLGLNDFIYDFLSELSYLDDE